MLNNKDNICCTKEIYVEATLVPFSGETATGKYRIKFLLSCYRCPTLFLPAAHQGAPSPGNPTRKDN